MTRIVYVAHPVGHNSDRSMNISSTKFWLRALVDTVDDVAFAIPWLPYVEVLDEATHRPRGIRDDLAQLDRCDACVLVGGRVSPGMAIERDRMAAKVLPIVDLTGLIVEGAHVGILTMQNFHLTLTPAFRQLVRGAFGAVA